MDRLRDQHPAAVTGESPPPRFVVIGLFPPPGHADFDQPHRAQRAVLQQRGELFGDRTEPVLEHNAKRVRGPLAGLDQRPCPGQITLDRLLHQDRQPGSAQGLDDALTGIGRGQHNHEIQRLVRDQGFQIGVSHHSADAVLGCGVVGKGLRPLGRGGEDTA